LETPMPHATRIAFRFGALSRLFAVCCAVILLAGCDKNPYSQKTPEDVIKTASLMVKNGDVKLLPNLIYAENKDMRACLRRLSSLCENIGLLAIDLQAKFPGEVAKLKADAQQAASEGRSSSILGQLVSQAGGGTVNMGAGQRPQRRRGPQDLNPEQAKEQQDEFQASATRLFTDPFGMLEEAEGKLSITPIDNDTVAILYDDKPVLSPIGMTMRKAQDGKWYVVLPTNLPGAKNFLPQNHAEYSIVGSLIRILDNAVIDLRKDVNSGELKDLDDVSRRAGEKAFIPMVSSFFFYSRAIEARNDATKAASAAANSRTSKK
jgi:hypothetical protein